MGLFSSSKSSSSNRTDIETNNSSVQGNEGLNYSGLKAGGDLSIVDGGAIERMFQSTLAGLNLSESLTDNGLSFAGNTFEAAINNNSNTYEVALDNNRDITERAFDFSSSTNNSANALITRALTAITNTGREALLFSENAGNQALNFAYEAGRPEAAATKLQTQIAGGALLAAIAASAYVATKRKRKK